MNYIPEELVLNILSFLPNNNLNPINKSLFSLYRSNLIWKDRVINSFGNIKSNNYFKEYVWAKKLEKHKFMYQRAYTYGCVGKNTPLIKPNFKPSIM
jgi:hypothetical protein